MELNLLELKYKVNSIQFKLVQFNSNQFELNLVSIQTDFFDNLVEFNYEMANVNFSFSYLCKWVGAKSEFGR